jgi:hypothetical protein
MAAVYLHHLLRILVMGHELKYMDYPLFGQFALCVSQAEADGAERCEEPRWKVSEINAIPIGGYALQLIAMLVFAWLSSRTGKRARWIVVQMVSTYSAHRI